MEVVRKEHDMHDNTVTDVRDIARGAVEILARRMIEIANPRVFPLEWSKDDAALLVSADGVHVRLVPSWDRIRHARVNVYVSDETTKPDFHYEWFRPCKTVFAESICDDPLDEFDGMAEALVKDLRRIFANSFDLELEDADKQWHETPKRISVYDENALRRHLLLPTDSYDPSPFGTPLLLSFDDLADHRRTEPIVYSVNRDACKRGNRPADQPGADGLILGSYVRIRSDEFSDEERDSGDVAFVSICDSIKHIDGETYERVKRSAKIRRATETKFDHDLVEYVETITEAFRDAGFDVVRADYSTARVRVRHHEYGEFEIRREINDLWRSYNETFSVRCLDLMCATRIGASTCGDDMCLEKDGRTVRTVRYSLPEVERKNEFRTALMRYIKDEMPRIVKECFEYNTTAQLGWSRTSEFFDNPATYCSYPGSFDTVYDTITTDAGTTTVYKEKKTEHTPWNETTYRTKTSYFAVRELNRSAAGERE